MNSNPVMVLMGNYKYRAVFLKHFGILTIPIGDFTLTNKRIYSKLLLWLIMQEMLVYMREGTI